MKISQARFAGSSTTVGGKPKLLLPEFAFIGRSNVGKSSLINMICANSRLAMTSAKPGKTRVVNHFEINGEWYLVDLPGYGYAKAPQKEREAIEGVIRDYLNHSAELKRLFILIDSRHDLTTADASFIGEIAGSDIPWCVIFTKSDKLGPVAGKRQQDKIAGQIAALAGAMPEYFASSAISSKGKEEILKYIELCMTNTK